MNLKLRIVSTNKEKIEHYKHLLAGVEPFIALIFNFLAYMLAKLLMVLPIERRRDL